MPNRIIKESICTSEEIDILTPDQEVFFYRLTVVVDDFGLMDARLSILKAKCYPLKSIDINSIQANLAKLQSVGLVSLYQVDGKPYLSITSWAKHQQIRAKRAKYPMPGTGFDINCNQLQSNAPVIQSNPIRIQSESESNPNPIKKSSVEFPEDFNLAYSAYPERSGANKKASFKAWQARIKAGTSPQTIIDGVLRYAAYCQASRTEQQYIKQPATFFGPDEHYLIDWSPPPASAAPANTKQALRDSYDAQAKEANERIFGNGKPTASCERDVTGESSRIT